MFIKSNVLNAEPRGRQKKTIAQKKLCVLNFVLLVLKDLKYQIEAGKYIINDRQIYKKKICLCFGKIKQYCKQISRGF